MERQVGGPSQRGRRDGVRQNVAALIPDPMPEPDWNLLFALHDAFYCLPLVCIPLSMGLIWQSCPFPSIRVKVYYQQQYLSSIIVELEIIMEQVKHYKLSMSSVGTLQGHQHIVLGNLPLNHSVAFKTLNDSRGNKNALYFKLSSDGIVWKVGGKTSSAMTEFVSNRQENSARHLEPEKRFSLNTLE